MKFIGIIPARYDSTRFPGKPLAMVKGKSMIQRVYQQASKCTKLDDVVVATDDSRIFNHVSAFGKVVMTSRCHNSGTDRCLEAFNNYHSKTDSSEDYVIVNIQGDEPFISPEQIDLVINTFEDPQTRIATLVKKIESNEELFNENVVKVVISKNKRALYFSRQPIPFLKNAASGNWIEKTPYYKHIGLYAYRLKTLEEITSLPQGNYEIAESLEQLRWLENNYSIVVSETFHQALSVDTPQDLDFINTMH